jgi:serine/threonine protein kinase
LRHPHIVQLLGIVTEGVHPMMVMEMMPTKYVSCLLALSASTLGSSLTAACEWGFSLATWLKETHRPDQATAFKLTKDIALGMNFLHGSTPTIVHYDLKPSNILVHTRLRFLTSQSVTSS